MYMYMESKTDTLCCYVAVCLFSCTHNSNAPNNTHEVRNKHVHIMYLSQSVCEAWLSAEPLSLQLYRDREITSSSWDPHDRERSISQPLYVDQEH